ncbi:MAG: amidohydrolase [Anaerolineae bacterium]|nr:amidohydrolase [Anaerolineae bacterium]
MGLEKTVLNYLDANRDRLARLAKDIWDHPEVGLQEFYASKLIADVLEKAGFSVNGGVAQMPTAFVASWGEGKPVIGILGEYDALPGLSQKVSATKEPIEEGAPGHGCGHNLFGVASLGAALAVKEAMEESTIKGTIRYYGCPAEETMIGKIFMARAGVFDDLDAAIGWHPFYANTVWSCSSLAMNSFKVNFHGVAAHASAAPEAGRSALDGVQLMDVGVNYLREHIVEKARIHCVITKGGEAPNVVPPFAQVWYYVRAPLREQVEGIYSRMLDIAKGAALMTGTTFEVDFLTGGYDMLPNDRLGELLLEKLKQVGPPQFTDEEKDFAKQLQATLPPDAVENILRSYGLTREEVGDPLCDRIVDPFDKGEVLPASTDVSDVSYITPTAQVTTCCQALGTPVHSWQNVAFAGSSIGFKGMMLAAKAMALAALDLETKPDILKAARDEFEKKTEGKKYVSPLPEGTVPH